MGSLKEHRLLSNLLAIFIQHSSVELIIETIRFRLFFNKFAKLGVVFYVGFHLSHARHWTHFARCSATASSKA